MKNNLTVFNFGSNAVRVVTINGEPWFVGKDICDILGHPNESMLSIDNYEKKVMTLINESGLYSFIRTSRKPEAKAFEKWVTSEVLPAIHKNGTYSVNQPAPVYNNRDFLPSTVTEAVQIGTMLADVLNLHGTDRTAMILDALKLKVPEYLSLITAHAPRITTSDLQDNITEEHFFTGDVSFDAMRFQWLTTDHSNASERQAVRKIFDRIGTMSTSSVRQAVDIAMGRDDNLWSKSLNHITFCVLVLKNGVTINGESVCASPENFNTEFERKVARENAVQKFLMV